MFNITNNLKKVFNLCHCKNIVVKLNTLFFSSSPNTEALMIFAEFLWKSSNLTDATAPRMREAMALHASPMKSGTEKSFAPSLSS